MTHREQDRLKAETLAEFISYYPDLPELLRNTRHYFDTSHRNPYHLEDDCWSHTMMVLKMLDLNKVSVKNYKSAILACLLHDIGKPATRKSNCEQNKVTFYGHAEVGTQLAFDMLIKLYDEETVLNIIFAINKHTELYTLEANQNNLISMFNFDHDKLELSYALGMADTSGQFCLPRDVNGQYKNNEVNILTSIGNFLEYRRNSTCDFIYTPYKADGVPDVHIFCGPPGSGKDYIANTMFPDCEIFSFDKIRIDHYLNNISNNDTINLSQSQKDIYSNAFNDESVRKLNLEYLMKQSIQKFIKNNKDKQICICNTNMTKKARTKLVKMINNIYNDIVDINCYYILAETDQMIWSDTNRDDKTVGKSVIDSMISRMSLPVISEGFYEVKYIINKHKCN